MGCSNSVELDIATPLRPIEEFLLVLMGKTNLSSLRGMNVGAYQHALQKLKEDVMYVQDMLAGLRSLGSGFGDCSTIPLNTIHYIYGLLDGRVTVSGCNVQESVLMGKDLFVLLTRCRGSDVQAYREVYNFFLKHVVLDDLGQFFEEMIVHSMNYFCNLADDSSVQPRYESIMKLVPNEDFCADISIGIHLCLSDIHNISFGRFDWMACMMRMYWPTEIVSPLRLRFLVYSEVAEKIILHIPPFGKDYLESCVNHRAPDALVYLLHRVNLDVIPLDYLEHILLAEFAFSNVSIWTRIATAQYELDDLYKDDKHCAMTKSQLVKELIFRIPILGVDRKIRCSIPSEAFLELGSISDPDKKKKGEDKIPNMILSNEERKEFSDKKLTYFDPDYIHLKVGAESTIKEDQVRSMVPINNLDAELQREQILRQVSGTLECFLCEGYGSMDELYRVYEEEERWAKAIECDEDDKCAAAVEGKLRGNSDVLSDADVNIRSTLASAFVSRNRGKMKEILTSREGQREMNKLGHKVCRSPKARRRQKSIVPWFYAKMWIKSKAINDETLSEGSEEVLDDKDLPYGGDMSAAMKNNDRAAIRLIMTTKNKRKAKQAKQLQDEEKQESQNGVTDSSNSEWIPFGEEMCLLLEQALADDNKTLVEMKLEDSDICNIDVKSMTITNTTNSNFHRKLLRRLDERRLLASSECWLCRGTGYTSKWMENEIDYLMKRYADKEELALANVSEVKDSDETKVLCALCLTERAKYGMSLECEHLYCDDCISRSLESMLYVGQFPPYCVQCRAESAVQDPQAKLPSIGEITRPALTFLRERSVITKEFQYRFLAGMKRKEGKEEEFKVFPCPTNCGSFIFKGEQIYELKKSKLYARLGLCACGTPVCQECEEAFPCELLHACKSAPSNLDTISKSKQTFDENAALVANIGKKCPVCGLFIQKDEGCDYMMCGDKSHGCLADALRNGGCGISFKWEDLQVVDDPCGYQDMDRTDKRAGRPLTARMLKDPPKCRGKNCPYFASTDNAKLPQFVPNGGSNSKNNGGEYCCIDCKDGKVSHHMYCHKIRVKEADDMDYLKASLKKMLDYSKVAPTKYLMPFNAWKLRLVWPLTYVMRHAERNQIDHSDFSIEFITTDDIPLALKGVKTFHMNATINSVEGDPLTEDEILNGDVIATEVDFGGSVIVKGMRSSALFWVRHFIYIIRLAPEKAWKIASRRKITI